MKPTRQERRAEAKAADKSARRAAVKYAAAARERYRTSVGSYTRKEPALGSGFRVVGFHPSAHAGIEDDPIYERAGVRVISSLVVGRMPEGKGDIGPQWHVSISDRGGRPNDHTRRAALGAFGLAGANEAEEDNHHPGRARHFWLVCDEERRVACECKDEEETIVEPDGYRWTNPKPETGEGCRGCEFERTPDGPPCPIHRPEASAAYRRSAVTDLQRRVDASLKDARWESLPSDPIADLQATNEARFRNDANPTPTEDALREKGLTPMVSDPKWNPPPRPLRPRRSMSLLGVTMLALAACASSTPLPPDDDGELR